MAELLPHSCFLHIPKTGGTWVRALLREYGLSLDTIRAIDASYSTENLKGSYHCVPTFDQRFLDRQHIFCFVRHPLGFYQSYWCFKSGLKKWNPVSVFDNNCRSDESFEKFIDKVIQKYPQGFLTWLYEFYASHATFVGKFENLKEDLITILKQAGEDIGDEMIHSYQPLNVTPNDLRKTAIYREDQVAAIMEIEKPVIEKYSYGEILTWQTA